METPIKAHIMAPALPDYGSAAVEAPAFALAYNGRAITADIAKNVLSIRYDDKTDGEADELEVTLEDAFGNWRGNWYPDKGATLVAHIGFQGSLLRCGEFEIDEVTQSGPPDVVIIRALAAGFTKSVRTKRAAAFENQTLRQMAEKIGSAYGFTVAGNVPNVTIERVAQYRKRDLGFLKKIALAYGCVFSIRGRQLVFTDVYALEGGRSVATLNRADLSSYSFTDKLSNTFAAANVAHHNPKTKKVVGATATAKPGVSTSADTLNLRGRVETAAQAEARAKAALHRANSKQTEGEITLYGRPEIVAGVSLELAEEMGGLKGIWYVMNSTHTISKDSGYTTQASIKLLQ